MRFFLNILASFGSFEFLALLALAAAKVTLLLAFAALLCLLFRRFSAATRHLLWASVLCASLLLPFLSFVTVWEVPVLPALSRELKTSTAGEFPETVEPPGAIAVPKPLKAKSTLESSDDLAGKFESQINTGSVDSTIVSARQAQPENSASLFSQLVNWASLIWLAGVVLFLLRLLVGFSSTKLLARRAARFENPELNELFSTLLVELKLKSTVRLLRSENTLMPVVCGILRPAILLPAEAETWSAERRKMVLLHELTHVARRDCLTQMLAQTACAFYWFNPFVWSAERRLRIEREQACDDFVLSVGTKPSDYAEHLLEIARSLQNRSVFEWSQTATVAIARKSQLEGRLLAILNKDGERRSMSRLTMTGIVTLICLLLFSLAAIRPTTTSAHKSQISGDNLKTNVAEKTSLIPFWSFTSTNENDNETIREAHTTQQNSELNKQRESVLNEAQISNEKEQRSNRNIENETTEEIAQENPVNQPAPEARPENVPAPNPFINAGYERERKTEAQEKSVDFIDEMASVGYTNLSVNDLIRLKQAGVTAEYVRSLRALGFTNLTVRELASMGLHGVTPAYIQAIRNAGYNDLSAKDFAAFRIHDVTPEFIKSLRGAGYDNLSARQLIDFATHEVTPAFISAMRASGFNSLSPRELVTLRIYDVTPEFILKTRSRFGELTIKQIITLRNGGGFGDEKDKNKEKNEL